MIKITRSPSFAVKECKNITPQVAFDFLFNGMHASLDALSFFHIRKTDETEVLAFDLNSIPFILKSIKGNLCRLYFSRKKRHHMAPS